MFNVKLIIPAVLLTFTIFSQEKADTIFFDEDWKETDNEDSISYYRLRFQEGSVFRVEDYFLGGKLQMTGTFSDAETKIKDGYFKYYSETGISYEGLYKNGKQENEWKDYDDSGKINELKNYKAGKYDGDFFTYYPDGTTKRHDIYNNGNFVSGKCYSTTGKKVKYYPYDEMASFPGGREGLNKYLSKNLKYPVKAIQNGIEGRVYLRYIIGRDGQVSDVKVLKGAHPLLDQAAIDVVKSMPKWNPGRIDGTPIRSYFDLPVNFIL